MDNQKPELDQALFSNTFRTTQFFYRFLLVACVIVALLGVAWVAVAVLYAGKGSGALAAPLALFAWLLVSPLGIGLFFTGLATFLYNTQLLFHMRRIQDSGYVKSVYRAQAISFLTILTVILPVALVIFR